MGVIASLPDGSQAKRGDLPGSIVRSPRHYVPRDDTCLDIFK